MLSLGFFSYKKGDESLLKRDTGYSDTTASCKSFSKLSPNSFILTES